MLPSDTSYGRTVCLSSCLLFNFQANTRDIFITPIVRFTNIMRSYWGWMNYSFLINGEQDELA